MEAPDDDRVLSVGDVDSIKRKIPESGRPCRHIRANPGKKARMGFLWGFFKAVTLVFAVIIAVLVVVDGSLLANLLGKKNE
jgi:hypothetical protein